jgi:hypothetical protein
MNENSQADAFELDQRVERGDCIVDGPFETLRTLSIGETLVPFDTIDDDGEIERGRKKISMRLDKMVLSTLY